MPDTVIDAMHKSMGYIERYKDDLLRAIKATRLIACEGSDEEIAKFLDMSCGIDYISEERGEVYRGYGCRFQPDRGGRKYNTFTIRKERETGARTEFEKRKAAIRRGGLYPQLTLHAYIDTERDCIDRLAIAKTSEIISYCEECNPPVRHTGADQLGQAEFYFIDWDKYRDSGRSIYVWHNARQPVWADAFCY